MGAIWRRVGGRQAVIDHQDLDQAVRLGVEPRQRGRQGRLALLVGDAAASRTGAPISSRAASSGTRPAPAWTAEEAVDVATQALRVCRVAFPVSSTVGSTPWGVSRVGTAPGSRRLDGSQWPLVAPERMRAAQLDRGRGRRDHLAPTVVGGGAQHRRRSPRLTLRSRSACAALAGPRSGDVACRRVEPADATSVGEENVSGRQPDAAVGSLDFNV